MRPRENGHQCRKNIRIKAGMDACLRADANGNDAGGFIRHSAALIRIDRVFFQLAVLAAHAW